jgi:hypothetical protein
VKYLVYFSTQAVNMVLTMNSNLTTPLEKFIVRKLDFRVDLRVAFGDYCQVSSADMTTRSLLAQVVQSLFSLCTIFVAQSHSMT